MIRDRDHNAAANMALATNMASTPISNSPESSLLYWAQASVLTFKKARALLELRLILVLSNTNIQLLRNLLDLPSLYHDDSLPGRSSG